MFPHSKRRRHPVQQHGFGFKVAPQAFRSTFTPHAALLEPAKRQAKVHAQAVLAATGGSALAAMRPIGTTNGQIEVEGNFDYHYQINVCDGCLNRCAVGEEEPVSPCTPGQNSITITDGCPAGETCMAGVCSP